MAIMRISVHIIIRYNHTGLLNPGIRIDIIKPPFRNFLSCAGALFIILIAAKQISNCLNFLTALPSSPYFICYFLLLSMCTSDNLNPSVFQQLANLSDSTALMLIFHNTTCTHMYHRYAFLYEPVYLFLHSRIFFWFCFCYESASVAGHQSCQIRIISIFLKKSLLF